MMSTSDKSPSRKWPADRPMWCDAFDMDLPKVIPDAREIVGDLGDLLLRTMGHTIDSTLNYPNVWNGHAGSVAFFGFQGTARPPGYVGRGDLVICTFWEALRDAWPHTYLLHVERQPIWNTHEFWPQFDTITADLRGWRPAPAEAEQARATVRRSLEHAVALFGFLVARHGSTVEHFGAPVAEALHG